MNATYKILISTIILSTAGLAHSAGVFQTVDFSSQANFTWAAPDAVPGEPTATRLPGAPVGLTNLAGVPFDIASNAQGKQAWHADVAANGNAGLVALSMAVNIQGVTNIYSLINTWEGHTSTNAWFVFSGSNGAVYTNYLVGGADIRDYNGANWENNINGTTTINIFSCPNDNWGGPGRLDRQKITLPAIFASQTLTNILLVDNGGPGVQRIILDGLTAESVSPSQSTNQTVSIWTAVEMGWASDTNKTYQVQWTTDLSNPTWITLGQPVQGNGTTNYVFDSTRTGPKHFYRVVTQ